MLFILMLVGIQWVSALNVVDTVLQDVWDSTGQTIRISYVSSESGWDVAEETALTNTVHPLVTFTHTTSDTPANGIGLSLDWYQETSAANTELGARMAVVTTDVTAASEDFKLDWMLMTAGAAPTTKMSLGSTGVLTLVNAATLDNSTNGTLTITEPVIAISGNQTVSGSVDITGAAGLILENDETITNAVNGTVLVTATTLATSGAIDVTGGGVTLENDATITNAVNGTVIITEPTISLQGAIDHAVCTMTKDDATPSVTGCYILETVANDGALEITDLDNPVVGSIVILVGTSATNAPTITDGGNFALSAGWTGSVDETLTLYIQADNDYIELTRSTN